MVRRGDGLMHKADGKTTCAERDCPALYRMDGVGMVVYVLALDRLGRRVFASVNGASRRRRVSAWLACPEYERRMVPMRDPHPRLVSRARDVAIRVCAGDAVVKNPSGIAVSGKRTACHADNWRADRLGWQHHSKYR